MLLGRLRWFITGVALIDIGKLDLLAGHFLHRFGQFFDLSTLLLIGRSHVHRQQVTEGVHRHVDLRSLLAFAPVISRPRPALKGRLQGSGVGFACFHTMILPDPIHGS